LADKTKDWDLYLRGRSFNSRISPNYYDTVDTNLAFFNGDQWRNIKDTKMPKPVFNIIKRVVTFFVASLTSSNVKLHFEPLLVADNVGQQEAQLAEIANQKVDDLLGKLKMSSRIRDALFDGANTGDFCAHFYWDTDNRPYGLANPQFKDIKGEICMELVDGTNVFFGNGNNPNVDAQPYIIISGRDMVENLKEEAKQYAKNNDTQPEDINSDLNYLYEAGDNAKFEVDADEYGKALYIIVYRKDKKTGTIHVSKSVENAYIYKDIDTGLKYYPIAWGNWEKVKNCYHGRALCTGILPNQIFINRMFAMVMFHLMMTAFPKAVYNADFISSWSNEIGQSIPVKGVGLEANIHNIAGYLEPGNMSNQIVQVIDLAMQYTKDTLGISDAALGNVKPDNTSAIIAVQKSSIIPLENPKANLYEWIEDIGRILFDMMGTYYGQRPIVKEAPDQQGQMTKQIQMFDFSVFKDMWFNVKADVGEASYWSEIAVVQTLDNLLKGGYLDIVDYLERVPDEYIPQKQELITKLQQIQQQNQQNPQPTNVPNISINFRDLPPDGQVQAASQAGIQLNPQQMQPPAGEMLKQIHQQAPPQIQQLMEQMAQKGMSDTQILQAIQGQAPQQPQPQAQQPNG
jgi:hypothetical protein